MEALRIITKGSGSNSEFEYKEFFFHTHHLLNATSDMETLFIDEESEDEEPKSANQFDEDGNDFDRTIELHFKDGSTVEIVYNEKTYRKLKQYFNV